MSGVFLKISILNPSDIFSMIQTEISDTFSIFRELEHYPLVLVENK